MSNFGSNFFNLGGNPKMRHHLKGITAPKLESGNFYESIRLHTAIWNAVYGLIGLHNSMHYA